MSLESAVAVTAVVAVGALVVLAGALGRANERNARGREKEKVAAYVRKMRRSLRDDSVVKRLHDTFKR